MKIDILTLFPEMFEGPFATSMLKKAQDNNLVEINIHDLRKWTKDKHKTVDGKPYGGGPGMVLMVEPIDLALKELKTKSSSSIILTSAKGKVYTQKKAQKLSKEKHLIIIAGHYEGVDERVAKYLTDEKISIGEYILTGGEIPAMVIVDSIARLIPGVLGNPKSLATESFSTRNAQRATEQTLLDFPTYTRPENYKGWKVPEVLLSGNHAEIEKWRKKALSQRISESMTHII
jgi:tRNA (guanine37-N1)-methyltransferase